MLPILTILLEWRWNGMRILPASRVASWIRRVQGAGEAWAAVGKPFAVHVEGVPVGETSGSTDMMDLLRVFRRFLDGLCSV